ncbi:hypothetical protein PtA15_7A442 [Puccinia triticina]|uniref:Uncharacterized protein n=1 Tax=Puccinia triticina TaxID=208348 RepID=A0ABY7CNA4_9BASI|nr:uncharacterized protein PtA15_7A442 [Puccinia triticina]WAQ86714.1 hypothetical protein PtA15_7A442 [Puccinia triticina]
MVPIKVVGLKQANRWTYLLDNARISRRSESIWHHQHTNQHIEAELPTLGTLSELAQKADTPLTNPTSQLLNSPQPSQFIEIRIAQLEKERIDVENELSKSLKERPNQIGHLRNQARLASLKYHDSLKQNQGILQSDAQIDPLKTQLKAALLARDLQTDSIASSKQPLEEVQTELKTATEELAQRRVEMEEKGVGYFANLSPKPPTGSSQLPATPTTTRTPALGVDAAQPDLLTHQRHPASAPSCSPSPHASHIPPITPPLPQSSTLVDPADQCSQPPNSLKFYRAWTASPVDIELDSSALSLASSPSGSTPRGSHVPSSPRWWFGKWPLVLERAQKPLATVEGLVLPLLKSARQLDAKDVWTEDLDRHASLPALAAVEFLAEMYAGAGGKMLMYCSLRMPPIWSKRIIVALDPTAKSMNRA